MLLLGRELPATGWLPVLACPPGVLASRARDEGWEVRETPWSDIHGISEGEGKAKRYPLGGVARAGAATTANTSTLARLVRRSRADVVVSNSFHAHPFVVVGSRIARRPPVLHLRDLITEGAGRRVLRAFGRMSAAVISNSVAVAATVPHRRAHVIVNPIEIAPSRVRPPWASDRPTVGFLGRLDPGKGLEDLIAAARDVPARVVVVGSPLLAPEGYVEDLRVRAADVGSVEFVGPVDEPAIAFAGFDVLAVPSRREPWGRVAAEALTLGVPVVAADGGGLPEIVTHGRDGLLYPPGDVAALAAGLRVVLGDHDLAAAMGAAGRESAIRFSPEAHAAAVAAVLESVRRR